jgi:hypothetical protein
VIVQGKFFPYHFLPVIAPLALLAVAGPARDLPRALSRLGRARWALAAIAAAGLAALPPYPGRFRDLYEVVSGRLAEPDYWSRTAFDTRDFSFRDDLTLVEFLRANTKPADRVNIWGFEPLMNFLAERGVVGRFGSSYPLTLAEELPELRREYLDAVRADPPEYFVVQRADAVPFALGHSKDSFTTFREFVELEEWVRERYVLAGAIGQFRAPDGKPQPRFLIYGLREILERGGQGSGPRIPSGGGA